MSPRLWTLVSSNHAAATEIEEIVADPELHREAREVAPKLAMRAAAAGAGTVALALQPLVLVYGIMEAAKAPAFWAAYDVLSGLPVEALEAGIRDYLAAPDSQFFPKPGPLKALCDKHAEPLRRAAYRAARAAALDPPRRRAPTDEERAAVHRLATECAASLKLGAAAAWPKRSKVDLPSIAGKPDETGITPEMRELLERRCQR